MVVLSVVYGGTGEIASYRAAREAHLKRETTYLCVMRVCLCEFVYVCVYVWVCVCMYGCVCVCMGFLRCVSVCVSHLWGDRLQICHPHTHERPQSHGYDHALRAVYVALAEIVVAVAVDVAPIAVDVAPIAVDEALIAVDVALVPLDVAATDVAAAQFLLV